jgi:hypothetical protein
MWIIHYRGMTLEQVLIMAYMNVLEGRTDDSMFKIAPKVRITYDND